MIKEKKTYTFKPTHAKRPLSRNACCALTKHALFSPSQSISQKHKFGHKTYDIMLAANALKNKALAESTIAILVKATKKAPARLEIEHMSVST
jgi:hypothetical protein